MCPDYEYAAGDKTCRGDLPGFTGDNPYADEAMWKVENAINAAMKKYMLWLAGWSRFCVPCRRYYHD